MTQQIEQVSANRSFSGWHRRFRHRSDCLNCDMTFAVYLPPAAESREVPLVWWLSGLTCTDENFMQKAGAHRAAAELGLAIVCPDTSPRNVDLPGEDDSYDFGSGAGFYINASRSPWNRHYRMYDYVTDELPRIIAGNFPVGDRKSICGHSMGGHGALVCALRNPGEYRAVSAFAPINNPAACDWGRKAFSGYLGDDRTAWREWDACELIRQSGYEGRILVDQGSDDNFLHDGQLRPEALEAACRDKGVNLELRMQPGYDHSYFFIASFIDEHLRRHAAALSG